MSSDPDRDKGFGNESDPDDFEGKGLSRPGHIYINHLLADEDAPIHAYLFQLRSTESVQDAVQRAIPDIRQGRHRAPGSPDDIEWNHDSYIVFILENPNGKLDGVEFKLRGTGGNHTFGDETLLEDFDDFTGVYYLNARIREGGGRLRDGDREFFKWHARHRRKDGTGGPDSHENSGTNVGP